MGKRRTLNYRELRSYDEEGGEERKKDEDEGDEEEDEDEDEETAEAEDEDAEAEAETEDGEEDEDGEPVVKAPKKKAAKAKAVKAPKAPKAAKVPKPKRTRASKVVRLRVVWGVYNNSNQRVAVFPYAKKQEAEAHVAKLTEEKKGQTYFVQPIKEPMEESSADEPEA